MVNYYLHITKDKHLDFWKPIQRPIIMKGHRWPSNLLLGWRVAMSPVSNQLQNVGCCYLNVKMPLTLLQFLVIRLAQNTISVTTKHCPYSDSSSLHKMTWHGMIDNDNRWNGSISITPWWYCFLHMCHLFRKYFKISYKNTTWLEVTFKSLYILKCH